MSEKEYLSICKNSQKYQKGTWYCLDVNDVPASSLILYENQFGLESAFVGIGSVSTSPPERNKGYATCLIAKCIEMLASANYSGIYLFRDTESEIYQNCGFSVVSETDNLMFVSLNGGVHRSVPGYF